MTDSVSHDEGLVEDEGPLEHEEQVQSAEEAAASAQGSGPVSENEDQGVEGDGIGEAEHGEEGELASMKGEFDQLNDRHLRLVAEFNNFRRRTDQERLGAWARAQADLVAKFLDVLDDLSRVAELDLSNATVEAIMEGVDLVERKFVRVLEDAGVEMIDPTGEAFDPELMEAMMRVPVDSEERDDEVAQVFQKGYSLKGVLIRPARVSVYKNE